MSTAIDNNMLENVFYFIKETTLSMNILVNLNESFNLNVLTKIVCFVCCLDC